MGMFGKSKRELLEWQNLVCSPSNKLCMTESQLQAATIQNAQNHIRIVRESINLCKTTKKPDVFFSRFNLMVEHVQRLAQLSKYIKVNGIESATAVNDVINQKPQIIRDFIDRCFDDINSLKTESAKVKRYQKILIDFLPYRSQIDISNWAYLENHCIQMIDTISSLNPESKINNAKAIIDELNVHIRQLQAKIAIPYDLTVNAYYTDPSKNTFEKQPLTPTGKEPKYPIKFHYETPNTIRWQFGDIWMLSDKTIGYARMITWTNGNGFQVHFSSYNGTLIISKVETTKAVSNANWETIYKV